MADSEQPGAAGDGQATDHPSRREPTGMDLVYVANSVVPSRAANSMQVMNMCEAFADNGHDVTLLVPDRDAELSDVDDVHDYYDVAPTFEIRKCTRPNLSSAGTFLVNYWIGREAAAMDPDLVFGRSVVACYFASLTGARTVFESHSPMRESRFGWLEEAFFSRLIGHETFEHLVVISDALREYYEEAYPHLAGNVVVARDAADPVDTSVQPVALEPADAALQVGYVGNLYEGRGMELVASLARRLSDVHFHVVGGDPDDVDRWQSSLADVESITFHGFVSPGELDRYRLAFDVQVAPYQHDVATNAGHNTVRWMSPLKIFEYMAAGTAIVASDLPAIREILDDGETALLADPDAVDEWMDALVRLRDEPDLRSALGARARADFLDNYTWEQRAKEVLRPEPRVVAGGHAHAP